MNDITAFAFGGVDLTPFVSSVDFVIPVEADTTYEWRSVSAGLKPGSLSLDFEADTLLDESHLFGLTGGTFELTFKATRRNVRRFRRMCKQYGPRPLPIDGAAYRARVNRRRKK